jgi:hypothetical protein
MKWQHPEMDSVSQLVEHLEILGIRPDKVASDRAGFVKLIATWGMAWPGGGVHANRAREIIARSGADDQLLARTKRLMETRAAERAAARSSAQAERFGNA